MVPTDRRIVIGLAALAIASAVIAGWFFFIHKESGPAGEFDVSDREHSAVRLSMLIDKVRSAERSRDPIEAAKGAVALERIELLCNNFEIDEDLDPACDHLLKAAGDPANGLRDNLDAAEQELRSLMSRRELAAFEIQEPWDADITDFEFDPDFRQAIYDLMIAMAVCSEQSWTCDQPLMDERIAAFLIQRLPTIAAPPENAHARITYLSTRELAGRVQQFADYPLGNSVGASFVVLAINRLGIQ